jgi:hypothetical protein
MANKKAEIKSKKRTVYLHENLFNEFSNLAKKNGSSASSILNGYMKKVVDEYNGREMQSIFD